MKKIQLFNQSGQVFILATVVLVLLMMSTLLIIGNSLHFSQNSKYSLESIQATNIAEAGVDKAVASLNATGGSYTGESETMLGQGSYSVTIVSENANIKIIYATGYLPNKTNPKVKRTIKVVASKGIGTSFVYGIQVGEGGMDLNSNNIIEGSVYSNGPIYMNSNNEVTGDVWVATTPATTADQETSCTGVNCTDYIFGKTFSGEQRLDVAQSFMPSISERLNKVSIKIRKIGTPSDATVRILADDNGKPKKSSVLATGMLYSNLVSGTASFVDITFDQNPQLEVDRTYWLMVDTSSNTDNYWMWENDTVQSYTRGVPKWSPNWNTGNPTWNNIVGDLSFKVYLGGTINSLDGNSTDTIRGNVHANTIQDVKIKGDAYYQTIINSQVDGNSYPGSPDPPPKAFPISQGNIDEWTRQAELAGVEVGDRIYGQGTCPVVIESKKIVGNVTFDTNCTATLKSPIWITGDLTISSSNNLKLDQSYGSSSGLIVVDGKVQVGSNNKLEGTGIGSSFFMVLSTFDSRVNGIPAVKIVSNGNTGVFYADRGIIEPGSNNSFKELTAWKIRLATNTTINYETGMSSAFFTSGPSGSYSLVKGSYQEQ